MSERIRWQLTPRQAFTLLAVVLGIALIALLVYLLLYLSPTGFTQLFAGEGEGELQPVMVIRGPGKGENPQFSRPMGAAFGPDGRIYVSDTGNNRICVFDEDGRFLFEFGGFGVAKPAPGVEATWEEGLLNSPLGIDVDEDGTVYVADFRNDSISVFDPEGAFIRQFPDPASVVGRGSSGQDGTGVAATDVAVADGKVYVTDTFQVLVFSAEGELLTQFGKPGPEPGDLDHPNGIEVVDGTIYVADSNHNRVTAFDSAGEVLWTLGEPVREVSREVEYTFGLPRGIASGEDERLLVVDSFEFDIAELTTEGELLARYGDRGTEPARFNFPNGIDAQGDLMVVADKENDRVQVLRLVR